MSTASFDRILEIKQALDARVESGAGVADPAGTARMLGQMRGVLSRELDRFTRAAGDGPVDGKAAVDLVALIARTLEKIGELEGQLGAKAAGTEITPARRAALHQTVEDLILTLASRKAERMVKARLEAAERPPREAEATAEERPGMAAQAEAARGEAGS